MRQFSNIAVNAFMELIRQPIFLLLMTASVMFEIFLAVPYYFAFGDEPKLIENSALAVMLLSGLFGAVLSASSSLAREIRSGTALAVLSKPVGRAQFLLAKFAGAGGGADGADLCEHDRRAARQPHGVRRLRQNRLAGAGHFRRRAWRWPTRWRASAIFSCAGRS